MLWHSDMIMCDEHKDGTVLNETMLRTLVNEGEVSPVYYLTVFSFLGTLTGKFTRYYFRSVLRRTRYTGTMILGLIMHQNEKVCRLDWLFWIICRQSLLTITGIDLGY